MRSACLPVSEVLLFFLSSLTAAPCLFSLLTLLSLPLSPEPKPKEPSAHQYDYDAQTVICFLKTYGLENDFKVG